MRLRTVYSFFFFNDTATTEIYTLSLHDALPIFSRGDAPDRRYRQQLHPPASSEVEMTTDTPTPLIEVQSISKYFGQVIALQDISMRVGAGEVMCLLGDNGAGKSTLIKILSGVHQHEDRKSTRLNSSH